MLRLLLTMELMIHSLISARLFLFLLCLYIFVEFSCAPMCLACSFFYPTPFRVCKGVATFFVTVVLIPCVYCCS